MKFRLLSLALLTCAACGEASEEARVDAGAAARPEPTVEARAVAGYAGLGSDIVDIALIPHPTPFLGRALAALESGGVIAFDIASGESATLNMPRVGALAAAPDFALRGSPAPLVFAAGGELTAPRAWVFLVEEHELVEVPLDPIELDGAITALCVRRATEAVADLLLATEERIEVWQVRDRGGDRLAAERIEADDASQSLVSCTAAAGTTVGVWESSRAYQIGTETAGWGVEGATDAAVSTREDSTWVIVAQPSTAGATLITPFNERVRLTFVEGFNTPSTPAPSQVASSSQNFGGAFGQGVLAIAEEDRINFIEINGVLDAALAAMRDAAAEAAREDS